MIHIANNIHQNVKEHQFFVSKDIPCVLEGGDLLDALCPVNENTGLRENFITLARKLVNDPAKRALLMQVLQELPTDNSMSGLSDEDRFDMTPQRLNVGTPAENDELRETFWKIYDHSQTMINNLKSKIESPDPSKINFDSADAPAVDA